MGAIPSWDYKNPWILRELTITTSGIRNPGYKANLTQPAVMKFSLLAIVLVALAIGSESASLVKREAPAELEKIAKYFQDLVDKLKNVEGPELANKASAYFEESRAQLQPMVEKLQEQLKPLSSNIEDHLKPLAASVRAQVAPLAGMVQSQVEDVLKFVADQTKAMLPPQ
ncbi:type-4 ice-structuring protein LS-12-like [Carassius gibelio]|uniref:type-4 ice-structuring protein LS-12-like n=1 Tax=Carassius gibelio TaxID=101364 RepID=UPI0022787A8A|nr:type-4 ice-structuring protein LS-12-like [Carassius gibelio]